MFGSGKGYESDLCGLMLDIGAETTIVRQFIDSIYQEFAMSWHKSVSKYFSG